MRYLTQEETDGLCSFLVEDCDEATGIEIHVGRDYRLGYEEPYRIDRYSLNDLSSGAFISVEGATLIALVGDRLYYKNEWGGVYSTGTEYAYRGVDRSTGDYLYIRAMVTYRTDIVTLPKEEIIPLDRILVRGNERVVGVKLIRGCRGIGGSNTSGFSGFEDGERIYTAEQLDGRDIIYVEGVEMCALAKDVLYFRYTDRNGEKNIFTLNYREREYTAIGDGIAYDTVEATKVVLLLDE